MLGGGCYDKPPVEIAIDDITKASSMLKLVNLTLDDYAFDVDRYKRLWTVTFHMYDDINVVYHVINGHSSTIPNTSRTGYDFVRWTVNGNTWNTSSGIEDNMVITAEYQINSFIISIDANGGSNSSNIMMEYETQLTEPTSTRANNILDGWYYSASYENHSAGEQVVFPITITGNLSIRAEWNVTITYNVKTSTYDTRTIRSGTTASNISCNANGYTFNYWYYTNSAQQFDFETIITQHLTLNANVTPIPYTITYVLNNGTNDSRNKTTYTIETNTFTVYAASRSNYYFEGWTGTGLSTPRTSFTVPKGSYGDRIYTADFRAIRTITFNSNGGSSVDSQQIPDGHYIPYPEDPTKEGYYFVNWRVGSTSGSIYDFSVPVSANMTLYATWERLYTVRYYSYGLWMTEYLNLDDYITSDEPDYSSPSFNCWYQYMYKGGASVTYIRVPSWRTTVRQLIAMWTDSSKIYNKTLVLCASRYYDVYIDNSYLTSYVGYEEKWSAGSYTYTEATLRWPSAAGNDFVTINSSNTVRISGGSDGGGDGKTYGQNYLLEAYIGCCAPDSTTDYYVDIYLGSTKKDRVLLTSSWREQTVSINFENPVSGTLKFQGYSKTSGGGNKVYVYWIQAYFIVIANGSYN